MKLSTLLLIIVLAIVASLLGWNYFAKPFANRGNIEPIAPVTLSSPEPGPTQVSLITNLTPEVRVAQLLAYPVIVSSKPASTASATLSVLSDDDATWITQRNPGWVTLFGSQISTEAAQKTVTQVRTLTTGAGLGILIAVDHEGGITQRLSGPGFTKLPSWRSVCTQSATQSAQLITESLAQVKQVGVNVVLAPVVDVGQNNPVLGSRVCGDTPEVVVQNARQFITIAQSQNLLPVLKHFPGIGSVTRDLHTTFDRVTITSKDAEVYRQLLDAFPSIGVMVTHVGVINQFPDIPCSLSSDCVGELRNNYPQSLVVSDALEMKSAGYLAPAIGAGLTPNASQSATLSASLADRSVAAVKAGNQVLFFGQAVAPVQLETVYQALLQNYRSDQTFKAKVDQAAEKIMGLKQSLGVTR